MARPVQSYVNTLVFAIVAGMISLILLLGLLFTTAMGAYSWFVITLEVGLITIIIWTLVRIFTYESRMRRMNRNATKNALVAQTCPDYYTVFHDAVGSADCRNIFRGRSPANEEFVMVYVPGTNFEADPAVRGGIIFKSNPPDHRIEMKKFEDKRINDTCAIVQGRDPSSADAMPLEANNYNIPWTDLRTKCEGFAY
jgi:hypothetical protein